MMKLFIGMLSSFFAYPGKEAKKGCFRVSLLSEIKIAVPFIIAVTLSSCGYHLVGQGDAAGAIPEGVKTVSLKPAGEGGYELLSGLKQRFTAGGRYQLVNSDDVVDKQTHVTIHVRQASEAFVPSAYDQSGIAIQYRMTVQGDVRLFRSGELIWNSGNISKSGDVFVSGGPTGIESARKRIRKDLQRAWIQAAWARINSGF